jgi:hypothetical protein
LTPLANNRVEHDGGAFGIVSGQRRCKDGDVGAEPAKCLRKLEPGRTGADNDQMTGAIMQRPGGLAGQIRRFRESQDRRNGRQCPGGDKEAPRLDGRAADRKGLRVGEPRRPGQHANAEAGDVVARRIWRDGCDGGAHVTAHGGKIDAEGDGPDAEACAVAEHVDPSGNRRQCGPNAPSAVPSSTRTVGTPNSAAAVAAARPPASAPMMQISGLSSLMSPAAALFDCARGSTPAGAVAPADATDS